MSVAKIFEDPFQLAPRVAEAQRLGQTVVFANGCFELLHVGHVRYLQAARELGDLLIVAVNTDDSLRLIKPDRRPVSSDRERMEIIAALGSVDYVIPLADRTPASLLSLLRPLIHTKGTDYTLERIPERVVVESYGGRVELVGGPKERSTTHMLRSIKSDGRGDPGCSDGRDDRFSRPGRLTDRSINRSGSSPFSDSNARASTRTRRSTSRALAAEVPLALTRRSAGRSRPLARRRATRPRPRAGPRGGPEFVWESGQLSRGDDRDGPHRLQSGELPEHRLANRRIGGVLRLDLQSGDPLGQFAGGDPDRDRPRPAGLGGTARTKLGRDPFRGRMAGLPTSAVGRAAWSGTRGCPPGRPSTATPPAFDECDPDRYPHGTSQVGRPPCRR